MTRENDLVDVRALTRRPPRFGSAGIPRGWFVVAFSEDLEPGHVHRMHYFGRDLIAYRGASGRAYVSDAYCPHLGAHLGHGGTIEGDSIRCPFHRWRFEGEGPCVEIPYGDKIPKGARIGALPVREVNGAVHVFVDPSGASTEPFDFPELDETGWTVGRTMLWRNLATHPQEVFENTVDTAHIAPIHRGQQAKLGTTPTFGKNTMHADVEFHAPGDIVGMPEQLNDVHLSVTLHGLGVTHVETHVRNVDVRARQRIYVTPVDEETVDIRAVVHVQESEDAAFTADLAKLFYDAYVEDFAKDFPIWENKRYLSKPQLAKGDGPIGAYRQWCTQFYAPKAVVADKPAARLETPSLRARWGELVARVRARLATPVSVASPPPAPPRVVVAKKTLAPVRSADDYFATLPQRFTPEAAHGVDAVFQWELSGEGGSVFHAHVQDGAIRVQTGAHASPSVSLVMPAEDYVRVVNGELDGMRAFTSGRGKVRGSIPLAMKMRTLFPA